MTIIAPFNPDRRDASRRNALLHGWLVIEGRPRIACLVRNISQGGALIECPVPKDLPAQFTLLIESNGFEATCQARHQRATWLGVQFVAILTTAAPVDEWETIMEYIRPGAQGDKPAAQPQPTLRSRFLRGRTG